MKKKENPLLVSFDNIPKEERWGKAVAALKSDYTISIRGACQILKCDRSWVDRYVRPNIHYIYLPTKAAYIAYNAKIIQDESSVWMHRGEFCDLIKSHLQSITQQTIHIPIECIIDKDKMEPFHQYYETDECIYASGSIDDVPKRLKSRKLLIKDCLSEVGKVIYDDIPNSRARTQAPGEYVDIDIDVFKLDAAHDLRGYGDTSEVVYRQLFENGSIRMELGLPDKDGCISNKIYYYTVKGVNHPGVSELYKNIDSVDSILIKYKYLELIKSIPEYSKFFI